MNIPSLGDLANDFMMRRQNTALKTNLQRLTEEITTGRTTDTGQHLNGRLGALAGFQHDLSMLKAHRLNVSEATIQADTMQTALGNIQNQLTDLGNVAALSSTGATPLDLDVTAGKAAAVLDAVVASLNTHVSGRAVFSGTEITRSPLSSSQDILNDLRSAVSGMTTSADVLLAADAFFDTPGGAFETALYHGADEYLAPQSLGAGETVALNIRADDKALREVIKTVALTALANDPGMSLDQFESRDMMQELTQRTLAGHDDITRIQADLGYAQERLANATVRITTELTSVELASNELVAVDPYQTAIELESVQVQLEMLYTVTARSSRLSLMNFLK